MCSIIGSLDKSKFKALVNLNQFRGNFSYSFTVYSYSTGFGGKKIQDQVKGFGQFDTNLSIGAIAGCFYIGHVQAPTGGLVKDFSRIHPTQINSSMLWHNGIITSRGIKYLQKLLDTTETFDTLLLHQAIQKFGVAELSKIEGLFACLYYDSKDFFIFRSKHAKLYIDEELSISSERFEGSKCINYDTVYKLDFNEKDIIIYDKFKTLRYNIVISGEL